MKKIFFAVIVVFVIVGNVDAQNRPALGGEELLNWYHSTLEAYSTYPEKIYILH